MVRFDLPVALSWIFPTVTQENNLPLGGGEGDIVNLGELYLDETKIRS
jgi:hypothetical protein